MKKYAMPVIMLAVFETVAITLWLTKGNLFYLFNFSYIGISVSLGVFLFIKKYKHARRVVQLLVGLYMLVYLGLICNENRQIHSDPCPQSKNILKLFTMRHDADDELRYLSVSR